MMAKTSLRLRLSRRAGCRVADRGAVDDEFDAAIFLPAFRCVVACDWLGLAKALRGHRACGHALRREEITHRIGALFRESLVHLIAANAVGVTFDLHGQSRMRE